MESLFSEETLNKSIERLNSLTPENARLWGKMDVAQMLAHCNETMEVARGRKHIKRGFISYVLGAMLKKHFYNDAPVKKNSPTHPTFVMVSQFDLDSERNKLIEHLKEFQKGGEAKCTDAPHAFFGTLTKEQWGKGMYKHLDHHLQQFGA
jgi:hypothetical protein